MPTQRLALPVSLSHSYDPADAHPDPELGTSNARGGHLVGEEF